MILLSLDDNYQLVIIQYFPLMYGFFGIEIYVHYHTHFFQYFYVHVYVGVLNLRSTQRTTDRIIVVWDPTDSLNCGPALYYIVTIRNLAISCDTNSFDLNVPRAEFHDLINNVAYTISVAAVNRAGVGMETTINVTTLAVAVATSDTSQGLLLYTYKSLFIPIELLLYQNFYGDIDDN